MPSLRYYSRGKFLISGEYLVMKGALALALPLKFGQSLEVSVSRRDGISWKSFEKNMLWFEADFSLPSFEISKTSDTEKAVFLKKLLQNAFRMNPDWFEANVGFDVISKADFDLRWGLGSSSTLISNVAWWFGINPFDLHFSVSGGSAYDIACARATGAIFYQLNEHQPVITPVSFNPVFKNQLYFVYSGKKQRSDISILQMAGRLEVNDSKIDEVSAISKKLAESTTISEFELLIDEHEQILSELFDLPTVKRSFFPDFSGSAKWLGAWGGDFFMMTWKDDPKLLSDYLTSKGFDTVFSFNDMVLPSDNYY
ncbi:MAG TPA: GYDIA family GHMP kinase [Bacteroidales bacterium]|nr:GYDIA family GHMP kinase [Bacteroidales bacterium]